MHWLWLGIVAEFLPKRVPRNRARPVLALFEPGERTSRHAIATHVAFADETAKQGSPSDVHACMPLGWRLALAHAAWRLLPVTGRDSLLEGAPHIVIFKWSWPEGVTEETVRRTMPLVVPWAAGRVLEQMAWRAWFAGRADAAWTAGIPARSRPG